MIYKYFYTIAILLFTTSVLATELITPIPLDFQYDKQKAFLGQKLFHDTQLSGDNSVSCASCHIISEGGDDNLPVAIGIEGKTGTRNSPTVLNSRYNFVQFWDGRAKDLQEQAEGPIHNPIEMDSNFKEVIGKLSQNKEYQQLFEAIYKDGITALNITDAITEFEKSLVTPNSRFDKYLRGDQDSLSQEEKEGFELFKSYGCISCHNGVNIGGNLFQKMGIVSDFSTTPSEFGRFSVTKEEKDKLVFKVLSLRNIALTAPYFHDGSIDTLTSAVGKMIDHQVGIALEENDIDKIVSFLETLTGELPVLSEEYSQ